MNDEMPERPLLDHIVERMRVMLNFPATEYARRQIKDAILAAETELAIEFNTRTVRAAPLDAWPDRCFERGGPSNLYCDLKKGHLEPSSPHYATRHNFSWSLSTFPAVALVDREEAAKIADQLNDWPKSGAALQIANEIRALPPYTATPSGPQTCVKCQHSAKRDNQGRCLETINGQSEWRRICGCKCEFPAASTSAVEAAAREIVKDWTRLTWARGLDLQAELTAIITRHMNHARPAESVGWQDIKTAPVDTRIRIMERETNWIGTGIRKVYTDADGHLESFCRVLHYNGEVLVPKFYATHWMPAEEKSDV